MRGALTLLPAFAAVGGVVVQFYASAVALFGAAAAGATFAFIAYLVVVASVAASTAVTPIARSLDASAVTLGKSSAARDLAGTLLAGALTIGRRVANVAAFVAVVRVAVQIDACVSAFEKTLCTLEIAAGFAANGEAVGRAGTTQTAAGAVLATRADVHTSGGAVGQALVALGFTAAVRADLSERTNLTASAAMLGIRSLLDALARASLERGTTGELTHAALAGRGGTVDLGARLAAASAVLRVDLDIEAGAAARRVALATRKGAIVLHAHSDTVRRRAARSATAAAVGRVAGKHRALFSAARFAFFTAPGWGFAVVDEQANLLLLVALVAGQAKAGHITRLTVEIRCQVRGAGAGEQTASHQPTDDAAQHQKLPSATARQPSGLQAAPTCDWRGVLRTSSTPPVTSSAPPTPASTRAVVWRLRMAS